MNSAHCVDPRPPYLQLLSNGSYHVMVNSGGGGYSRWKNLSITRWREDATCDHWGAFCYLRDRSNGDVWSTSYQPTQRLAIDSDPVFEAGRASFHTRHQGIDMDSDIAVSPDDDVELCRVQISNHSAAAKDLDVTSYREIVLAPSAEDSAHPAFAKLFVETEIVRECQAILCRRRPQTRNESTPWMFHMLVCYEPPHGAMSFETDRMRFIGNR